MSQAPQLVSECPPPPGPGAAAVQLARPGKSAAASLGTDSTLQPHAQLRGESPDLSSGSGSNYQSSEGNRSGKHCHLPGPHRPRIFRSVFWGNCTSAHLPHLTKCLPSSSHLGSRAEKAADAPCTGAAGIPPLQPWEAASPFASAQPKSSE